MYPPVNKDRRMDAAFMKKIAIITMFIDHVTYSFLEVARNAEGQRIMNTFAFGKTLDEIGRGIGRLAFPVFCFSAVFPVSFYRARTAVFLFSTFSAVLLVLFVLIETAVFPVLCFSAVLPA